MRRIYKYMLKVQDTQKVSMPIGSDILTIQVQKDELQLWAMVTPDIAEEVRIIEIFGTGNPIDGLSNSRKYISTFQLQNGSLVFHAFEYIGI